jgi:hypothetical protein
MDGKDSHNSDYIAARESLTLAKGEMAKTRMIGCMSLLFGIVFLFTTMKFYEKSNYFGAFITFGLMAGCLLYLTNNNQSKINSFKREILEKEAELIKAESKLRRSD